MSGETIYHLLGKISVTFASLEHRLVNVLEYLLTEGKDTLVRPYILDDMPISRLIQQTRSAAELRLWEHKAIFTELNKTLKDIDHLREQRNIFIHGDWFSEELLDNANSVTVLDYKPRLNKDSGLWEYLNSVLVTKTKLYALLRKATTAIENLTSVGEHIRKLKLR
jgi:hypothetical protein